ncbi:MAG: hypothetical protein H6767_00350 [Candidatus Peribacteria bacterium]|nr:MAG: hypothetical protein H6767_00350 [Candidatus Peribacteria bacterium]
MPISESLDFIDEKLQPEIEDFVEKYTPYIERLRLFDKELPFYNTPSNQRVLDTELFNAALES